MKWHSSFACFGALALSCAPIDGATVTNSSNPKSLPSGRERQITRGPGGRIVTNIGDWSPDSRWIVYDTRSDAAGERFDGSTIEMVNIETGERKTLYRSANGAHCGVVTFHPHEWKVVFILGPENPTTDWQYATFHRQGVIVDIAKPRQAVNLDARDLTPPFTPGALRGGSHVHVWDPRGDWVSFTYEDHVLARFPSASATNDINLRNIGVSVPGRPVSVLPASMDGIYSDSILLRTMCSGSVLMCWKIHRAVMRASLSTFTMARFTG